MHRESADKQKVFETPGPGGEMPPLTGRLLDSQKLRFALSSRRPVGGISPPALGGQRNLWFFKKLLVYQES